eukprot:TRINITY_DN48264_c0_g1_i1.p1 TRINITY_DN48264_c0_g1~~TRINITY_DN48264_c0_g1_i1.p1  ORF type:complete len:452 (+),score=47.73 TRINITY_DN48264_c0_g1_i1:145-1500(+)
MGSTNLFQLLVCALFGSTQASRVNSVDRLQPAQPCPPGSMRDPVSQQCLRCPAKTVAYNSRCVGCPTAGYLPAGLPPKCNVCDTAAGYVMNRATKTCVLAAPLKPAPVVRAARYVAAPIMGADFADIKQMPAFAGGAARYPYAKEPVQPQPSLIPSQVPAPVQKGLGQERTSLAASQEADSSHIRKIDVSLLDQPLPPVCPSRRPQFLPVPDPYLYTNACWRGSASRQPNGPMQENVAKIVTIGDSLTEGKDPVDLFGKADCEAKYDVCDTMTPWPSFLQQIVGGKYRVLNRGCYGQTIEMMLSRVENDLRGLTNVKLVTVMAGTNNLWTKPSSPQAIKSGADAVVKLLISLYQKIESIVGKGKLAIMAIPQGGLVDELSSQRKIEINRALEKYAAETGAFFVGTDMVPWNGRASNYKDECGQTMMYDTYTHFGSDGYRQIANLVHNSVSL